MPDLPSGTVNALPRDGPYIWITWLAPLLAGDTHCEWATWFRAHYKYQKPPFGNPEWIAEHNEMVLQRKQELKAEGWTVSIEKQNQFAVTSPTTGVTIGARPDIIARKGEVHLVEDCKTRLEREAHFWQVLMYMLLLPSADIRFAHATFHGRLVYRNSKREIETTRITPSVKALFRSKVQTVGGDEPPDKVPSHSECGLCDISSDYCDERIEAGEDARIGTSDLF